MIIVTGAKDFYAVSKIYGKAVVALERNLNTEMYRVTVRGRSELNVLYCEEYPTFAAAKEKFDVICNGFEHKPEIETFAKAVEDAT